MTDRPAPPVDGATRHPTRDQLGSIATLPADRPVLMLDLLRIRDVADDADTPDHTLALDDSLRVPTVQS